MRTVLPLDPDFNVMGAAAQRDKLLAWLTALPPAAHEVDAAGADTPAAALDLGAVESFDSAGVQLLLACQRSLAERGLRLQLLHTPPLVRDSLATLGLLTLLDDTPSGDA